MKSKPTSHNIDFIKQKLSKAFSEREGDAIREEVISKLALLLAQSSDDSFYVDNVLTM